MYIRKSSRLKQDCSRNVILQHFRKVLVRSEHEAASTNNEQMAPRMYIRPPFGSEAFIAKL